MANKVVIFPEGKEAEARAYAAWTDQHNPWTPEPPADPTGSWSYVRNDAFGQWVVPFLGDPFEFPVGTPFPEPEGGEAMRADGVLHDYAIWPPEEL
ncbi:hypothetical protein QTA58_00155 [Neorhizobium sp. CSC1952]|uniref:hypothetical protein n=1 Tax=Neorhizobium sp. CSC1952 TaxID=2978974 RepID=UPI0025A4D3C7|nr:hypothetical protein [Rhizobium sp. CSC1952]WJR67192.1 hypothetical protein QTA58_23935 [Rhizobium sp. CSC1952]WJR67221.1 hypothetical protein QTA58_00155 [Rhizobium sp. CSC1952]